MKRVATVLAAWMLLAALAGAQTVAQVPPGRVAVPTTRVTFKDAIQSAMRANPTVQQAAAGILRAQGLLTQATSAILPGVTGNVVTTTLNTGRAFNGVVTTPQNQASFSLALSSPLIAPALWAQRTQARDVVQVAEYNEADVRRQVAVATAQAYLAVIARRRVYEADIRARDTASAHYDLAHQQRVAGAGSLLNEIRAQQLLASDNVLVEQSSLDVYRAQEALGVLVAADGPVDAADEPAFEVPQAQALDQAALAMPSLRTDVRLFSLRESAALRVWHDSWRDWFPTVTGLFSPQYVQPASIFQPSSSWRAQVSLNVPLFDAGFRRALKTERRASFEESQVQRTGVLRQARADVRTGREAVDSAARALENARASAAQARRVVEIVTVSFRAGAATSIEVIDAQRALLDAEMSVAVAEDLLRQAQLALLVALGRFP